MQYDPFQQEAIDHISHGDSVIVSAPTGAGKTAIAEHVVAQCLARQERVIYTAPIKALSNQKYRDFKIRFGEDAVGILTGDVTLNSHAPLLIMTTEIFRNRVLEIEDSLSDYSWIIFDEIHYIDDVDRGSVWEEALIFFPDHMRFLGLSATIPNIDELAAWLASVHKRDIKVVKETKRPVPLHIRYQCQGKVYDDLEAMIKYGFRGPGGKVRHGHRMPRSVELGANHPTALVSHLQQKDLLPCIYFVFSRRRAEMLAEEMVPYQLLEPAQRKEILALYDELCKRYDIYHEPSAWKLKPLVERGIGYHHAGMLPTLKEVVERLFTSRLLKVIFTTETFALGINMPARAVVLDELRKYYGKYKSFGPLKTRDFFQMAGRAGRRGIDPEGTVFCRINPHFTSPEEVRKTIEGTPEEVRSQFNLSYATILNLYQVYQEKIYGLYERSYHHYQVRTFLRKAAVRHLQCRVAVLKALGHIDAQGAVTVKGQFAGNIYGYELVLAEIFASGQLEHLSGVELAVLFMAMVYEPRKGTRKPPLSDEATAMESIARRVKRQVHKIERDEGLKVLSKRAYFHLAPAVEAWINGASVDDLVEAVDADEGEVVRYLRMTVQVLREVAETPVSDAVRAKIRHILPLIDRDAVDSEKQLRI